MPVKLRQEGNLWTAKVTPPHGYWQSPKPMVVGDLIEALRSIGCPQNAIDSALREAASSRTTKYWEDEIGPTLHATLSGEYEVPPQQPYVEAWLALVLFLEPSPIPMKEVVDLADFVNKTVPTPDEIAWAFLRLRIRGWFVEKDGLYGLTSEGRSTIESIVGTSNGYGRVQVLEHWLKMHPPSPPG